MTSQELKDLIGACTSKFHRNMMCLCPEMKPHMPREELEAQANLLVCEAIHKIPRGTPMNFYLVKVISNGLQNYMKKELVQRQGRIDADVFEYLKEATVEDDHTVLDMRLSLRTEGLSAEHKEILQLHMAGFTHKEIGQIYGKGRTAATMMIKRLIDKLKLDNRI